MAKGNALHILNVARVKEPTRFLYVKRKIKIELNHIVHEGHLTLQHSQKQYRCLI